MSNSVDKVSVSLDGLRYDSFQLAGQVLDSEWKPDYLVALWRGGAPIGMYCHEFFKWHGLDVDHVAVRTSRYTGINETKETVQVHSMSYILDQVDAAPLPWKDRPRVLIVDDVWDSGITIDAVIKCFPAHVDVRTAVVYYKPAKNKFSIVPDYHVHTSAANDWLVFPHELEGMTPEEVGQVFGQKVAALLTAEPKE